MLTFRAEDRIHPPAADSEAATILGFLNYQRDTLRGKCGGLSAAQLDVAVPPSALTLGGLLKHPADEEWSFSSAAGASPEQLFAWLDESIAVSDRIIADALSGPDGLGALSVGEEGGQRISLRWIVCHLIEEYARHNGHADVIRESIDGMRGE